MLSLFCVGGVAEGAGVERLYLELMVVSQFHYVHVVCPVLVVCVGSRGAEWESKR